MQLYGKAARGDEVSRARRFVSQEKLLCEEKSMKRQVPRTIALRSVSMGFVLGLAGEGKAQDARVPYPSMASVDQSLMERDAEIALARSAVPESISQDA